MPSLPLPLVHLVSLRSLLGRLGKTGVGTSHKPADISSLAINTNIVGRGPARHTRLISPVVSPDPSAPPGSGTGQLPAQGSGYIYVFLTGAGQRRRDGAQSPPGRRASPRLSRHHRDTVRAINDGVSAFGAKADVRWSPRNFRSPSGRIRWLWPLRRGYQHRRGNQSDWDRSQHQHHNTE